MQAMALLAGLFVAAVQASVLTPPVLPLFVRNPYLNVWLGDAREPPWNHWPIFWTGQEVRYATRESGDRSVEVTGLANKHPPTR